MRTWIGHVRCAVTHPISYGRAWFFTASWAVCAATSGLLVALNALSAFWVCYHAVFGALCCVALYWSIIGLLHSREEREMRKKFEAIAITFDY